MLCVCFIYHLLHNYNKFPKSYVPVKIQLKPRRTFVGWLALGEEEHAIPPSLTTLIPSNLSRSHWLTADLHWNRNRSWGTLWLSFCSTFFSSNNVPAEQPGQYGCLSYLLPRWRPVSGWRPGNGSSSFFLPAKLVVMDGDKGRTENGSAMEPQLEPKSLKVNGPLLQLVFLFVSLCFSLNRLLEQFCGMWQTLVIHVLSFLCAPPISRCTLLSM